MSLAGKQELSPITESSCMQVFRAIVSYILRNCAIVSWRAAHARDTPPTLQGIVSAGGGPYGAAPLHPRQKQVPCRLAQVSLAPTREGARALSLQGQYPITCCSGAIYEEGSYCGLHLLLLPVPDTVFVHELGGRLLAPILNEKHKNFLHSAPRSAQIVESTHITPNQLFSHQNCSKNPNLNGKHKNSIHSAPIIRPKHISSASGEESWSQTSSGPVVLLDHEVQQQQHDDRDVVS